MILPALQGADPEGQHTAEDTDSRTGCHIFGKVYAGHDTDSCQHHSAQKENHAHRQPGAAPQSPNQKIENTCRLGKDCPCPSLGIRGRIS